MKRLLQYLTQYKKECVLGPLFKLLEASFELLVPLVMAAVIDTGIKNRDQGYIVAMCLVLVGLGVVGLACSITAQFFAAKASVGFAAKVRRALFGHIQKLGFTELDQVGASTLITRMTSDINQVQNGMNLTLRLLLRSPFVVFGAMVMAFTIDWQAALVFVVAIPLLAAVVFGVMLWTMPRYKQVQAGLDKVLGAARENLSGARVVRAFGREEAETAAFQQDNNALTRLQVFVGRVSGLMNPVTYILINLATLVLVWAGGLRVEAGAITQGGVVALLNYMGQILVELVKLANLIINITKALACANRVADVMDIQPGMADGPETGKTRGSRGPRPLADPKGGAFGRGWDGVPRPCGEAASGAERAHHKSKPENTGLSVEFQDAGLTYQGAGAESLAGISFLANPGETIGIIGGTGSGKSSLVNLIPRFYDCTLGRVLVGGQDVKDWPLSRLRDQVGVVPQRAQLFSGTIRENLRWGAPDATDEELWQALEDAQAKDFVEQKAGGLDAAVSQGGRNFSGGQRQRLTIARALVRRPKVLILDDSASALDFATDARLRQAIRGLGYGPTVFIVSQRASSIRYADKIVVLDDGQAAGVGTHGALLETCGVYREICESQMEKGRGGL